MVSLITGFIISHETQPESRCHPPTTITYDMQLRYQIDDHIGRIILDNPPRNSLTQPVFANEAQLTDFLNTPRLKGVLVLGRGRHFCDGADPGSFARLFSRNDDLEAQLQQAKKLLSILSASTVPTVAVITGSCLGAGLEIALACHFRYAAESCMLGFPETGHRLLPGLGGSVTAGRLVHRQHLIDLILSGRMIGADEGCRLGLVDTIGPARTIEEMALRYLDSLTGDRSPELIRAVMQAIHNSSSMSEQDALAAETGLFCNLASKLTR
jgi:enoyl-CoA hydratase